MTITGLIFWWPIVQAAFLAPWVALFAIDNLLGPIEEILPRPAVVIATGLLGGSAAVAAYVIPEASSFQKMAGVYAAVVMLATSGLGLTWRISRDRT